MKLRVGMLRKLSVCLISAGLTLSPLSVQALGFGGIKLKSALNERLDAEVSLLSATANDIQSLKIRLATEEAFLRAGIARSAFLKQLDFKVKQYPNGDHYIHVTTKDSVREPFLDFLLDLNWKNGRMLREYTMLLDPPGRAAPQPTSTPSPVIAEAIVATPVIEPVPTQKEVVPEPEVLDIIQTPEPTTSVVEVTAPPVTKEKNSDLAERVAASFAEAEAKTNTETAIKPAPFDPESAFVDAATDELWPRIPLSAYVADGEVDREEAEPTEMGSLDYGISKADDNLWSIAEKLRNGRKDISVYQVMMALLQSNPNAFVDNNIHRLKVGQVLRIDDESTLTALSKKEAANAYIKQTNSWDNYRKQVAAKASVQPIVSDTTKQADTSSSQEGSGELTLSSPDGASLVAGGGANEETLNNDFATVQDQLRQTKADAGSMRTQNIALNEKLQDLEDELNRLQRSISVKDDELAALQHQLSGLGKETVEQADKLTEVKPAAEVIAAEVDSTKIVATPDTKTEVTDQAKATVDIAAEQAAKEKIQTKQVTEEATTEPVATESGIMDVVMGVGASIAAVVAGLMAGGSLFILAPILLLLLTIIVIIIKRRRQGEGFQESILTGAATTAEGDNAITNPSSASEESSFLDDFAMSGAGTIETDDSEVDPLTEADVFMAYGRYEAAEERLNEAVKQEPERKDLQVKLLELHHATKNSLAFEALAEDFSASLDGSEDDNLLWSKITTLGNEIAPENPLFVNKDGMDDESAIADSAETDDLAEMSNSDVMDIGLETGVFESTDMDDLNDDLDFSLDTIISDDNDFDLEKDAMPSKSDDNDVELEKDATSNNSDDEVISEVESDDNSLDFNMDFSLDEPTETAAATDTGTSDELSLDLETDDNALDFNFNLDDTKEDEATTDDVALDVTEEIDNELDFNIDSATDESTSESESSLLDFELDLAEPDNTESTSLDELDLSATVELSDEAIDKELESESSKDSSVNELDFDLSDDSASATEDELSLDLDLTEDDLSLDLDLTEETPTEALEPLELTDEDFSLDLNLDVSDTADDDILSGDEVGTKLDLAKAYIDMGDPEGARSILGEVLDEGSDKQKEEAQELLGQIV